MRVDQVRVQELQQLRDNMNISKYVLSLTFAFYALGCPKLPDITEYAKCEKFGEYEIGFGSDTSKGASVILFKNNEKIYSRNGLGFLADESSFVVKGEKNIYVGIVAKNIKNYTLSTFLLNQESGRLEKVFIKAKKSDVFNNFKHNSISFLRPSNLSINGETLSISYTDVSYNIDGEEVEQLVSLKYHFSEKSLVEQ